MTKKLFLAGWEVHLNGDEQCQRFLQTQVTTEAVVHSDFGGLELVFTDEKLTQAFNWNYSKKSEKPLKSDELGLLIPTLTPNPLLYAVEDPDGVHQLGGELPAGFALPFSSCVVPFQYLGFISDRDPNFAWLPFTIHLTCPIYLDIDKVFLDYADPLKPVLLNREAVEAVGTAYDEDLDEDTEIVYNTEKFNFSLQTGYSGSNQAGIPSWLQFPTIPVCPKSGKTMKFLCQLTTGPEANRTNVNAKNESFTRYYDCMNFWGDGSLYVFVEPTARTACYLIQNT
ncbi:hypothetical protein [Fibrella aquatilis]|uniref:Uncharacterized protein n=1 Tax=Fibrella aquatilis TaxID=2817059 RepID=A0A939K268_9BACT|nr:hypothetical protein [Fibrella aquatilis]MBO0933791.1 hypothetical protein [Fibrella aquatilis]